MPLNKQKGNMYPWVTHTWNAVKGRCWHRCNYCYMKRFWSKLKEPYLDEKCLQDDLGEGNIIFVGSSIDLFAENIPSEWISKVLEYCRRYPGNTYLFQSKNPARFKEFLEEFPEKTILGTTIETNRNYDLSRAPQPIERAKAFKEIKGMKKMVSIEPIIDFDVEEMVEIIKECNPYFVSIGADSKGNNLPEPNANKVRKLIEELGKFTQVKVKDNLYRILR